MTTPATIDQTARPRWRVHLRVEDVALFVWLVVQPTFDLARGHSPIYQTSGTDPLGGLFDLIGLCLAAACLVARRQDGGQSGLIAGHEVGPAVGPLVGAVAFALYDGESRLGLGDVAPVLLIVPVAAAVAARIWLPPTTAPIRRALVTPFILVTSGFFGNTISGITGIFDLRQLLSGTATSDPSLVLFVVGVAVVGVAIFYAMLVFAPRQIAEREGTPLTWTIRFLVFVLGLVLGATLAGLAQGLNPSRAA